MVAKDPAQALLALNRFGLGAKAATGGDLARIAADPRGYVRSQLSHGDAVITAPDLMTSDAAFRAHRSAEEVRRRERERKLQVSVTAPMVSADSPAPPAAAPSATDPAKPPARLASLEPAKPAAAKPPEPQVEQTIFRAEVEARFRQLTASDTGLLERLVLFWSNHFALSLAKGQPLRVMIGACEREAIRPHVLGKFADMLRAVEQHPAMLIYLDNQQSIGPNSRAGQNNHRGLNENLAREILELHTLGVDGGYSQSDVTSLARIITGWTFVQPDDDALYGGRFTFAPVRHEPGDHRLLDKVYDEGGLEQGEAALTDLAHHPSTAHHIAVKLSRHFVADEPPPALVERLAKTFVDTQGDLAAVTAALIESKEAWESGANKMRTPQEFVIAAYRATNRTVDAPQIVGILNALGQPLWYPPGPNGFPDTVAAWASPEGMRARLDVAAQLGRQASPTINPNEVLDAVVGAAASSDTRSAVERAESRPQGLALLFMSPEFQRR
jgi:uncharacterized protein (DUF1800 family)